MKTIAVRTMALAAATAAAIVFLYPARSSAFVTLDDSGQCYGETRWFAADLPLKYYINNAGSADVTGESAFTAVTTAFSTWATPTCSYFSVDYQGKTAGRVTSGDNRVTMEWVESNWPNEYGSGAIAVTLPLVLTNGRIVEADIQFNGVNYRWSTTGSSSRMDIQTIALHEQGHVIGLGDLYDGNACPNYGYGSSAYIMCGYGGNGLIKTVLKQDDKDGDCYLYPKGKFGPCSTDADCTSGQVCSAQVSGSGETHVVCIDPIGVELPGAVCTDTYNYPSWSGEDGSCRNLLCLEVGICSRPCGNDSECAHNMVCGDAQVLFGGGQVAKADFKGCTLPGKKCDGQSECGSGNVWAVLNIADVTLAAVCVNPVGGGADGASCGEWKDCRSGACVDGKCVSLCGDCGGCPGGYGCQTRTVTGEGGKTGDFWVCIQGTQPGDDGGTQNPDGGVNPGEDSGINPGDDSGTPAADGGVVQDGGSSSEECACDQTWECDPDCECDLECQGNQTTGSSGCSCSSVGL